jgi:hypothetical protein
MTNRDPRADHAAAHHRTSLTTAIAVLAAAFSSSASAKGGLSVKPPRPFTQQEIIQIEQCRHLARSKGADSAAFARECSAERPYLNP